MVIKMLFPNIRQDFIAHNRDWGAQGFWAMLVYRLGRWRYGLRPRLVRLPFSLLYKILFKLVQIICGIQMPCEAPVGKNFRIDHFGNIIISGYASFGDDCVIRNGVTIGIKNTGDKEAPQIGSSVNIGAGAKVLGPVKIGNNVFIGANAVVITDLPDNCIAVGVPAKIKMKTKP
jgi:serine O-acetyltransferase